MAELGEMNRSDTDESPKNGELSINSSLEDLQTDEQRRVLDTVAQIRKCGLESILSLPQIVVCGDQSSGKSSVLEALTEIPFPRNDNLCTRFATEIILRRAANNSLTIKVIPDQNRSAAEQVTIREFKETITDFDELPAIMVLATALMGIGENVKAFARDVLSIEIEGPSRPQLTLVDIPGLIQTETKGVTKADVDLVEEITDHYIAQPRTICLAVISATNDYANQKILTKVRQVDPEGDRTLGVITKPDRLSPGSGSEKAYLVLARNEDIFFKLGWHVLKNRSFEQGACSLIERNTSEAKYFSRSVFKDLDNDCTGISSLRHRLSNLLFEHVKQELPKLRQDLEEALSDTRGQFDIMGKPRTTPSECRAYLSQLSLDYYEICKAAVGGHYEGNYFINETDPTFSLNSKATIRRLRAVIQFMNTEFSETMRTKGHKYHVDFTDDLSLDNVETALVFPPQTVSRKSDGLMEPVRISKRQGLKWVSQALTRTRGRELSGNFNPLLVGELFWEQASHWRQLATLHVERVAQKCTAFLEVLLQDVCPRDVRSRLWTIQIEDVLSARNKAAIQELDLLINDIQSYPINYNHYYTDTIEKRRRVRDRESLSESLAIATNHGRLPGCHSNHTSATVNIDQLLDNLFPRIDPNMENVSCETALDCLIAIYKVSQKTFIANITTQVIERHIIHGLEKIFSPVVVNGLADSKLQSIASEPLSAMRQREHLEDRVAKLEQGRGIFQSIMGGVAI